MAQTWQQYISSDETKMYNRSVDEMHKLLKRGLGRSATYNFHRDTVVKFGSESDARYIEQQYDFVRYVALPYDYKLRDSLWIIMDAVTGKLYAEGFALTDNAFSIYPPASALDHCDKLNYGIDVNNDGLWSSGD